MPSSLTAGLLGRQRGLQLTVYKRANVESVRVPRFCRPSAVAAFRHETPGDGSSNFGRPFDRTISGVTSAVDEGVAQLRLASWRGVELRLLLQVGQVVASLAFVALYIWSTYEPAARGSWRHCADLALSCVFAADLAARIRSAGSSWPRMLLTPLSLLDVLSFAPGLLELCGAGWLGAGLQGVRLDLRWFRIFRALRLLRLCLLTGNLPLMKLSRSALLSGAVNVRLMQLVASVMALLFTSASLVHAVERLPWHDALYFVTTTLTTVGYGDVVVKTMAGRLIVLVFMAVGVVLIPVRTSQLWAQLASRRLTAGTLTPGRPVVLLSSRLTEVRGFADLTEEFFHQVHQQRFVPRDVHLMVLGNKPSYEFTAFQELHDQRITLVEGSVLSAADLTRCRAEGAAAVLVLGDRFAHDAAAEDLDVLFRVWAIKSYTKCVPLTVQVLRASSLAKVSPFLDPHQDVVMSAEQMRHRLLALSALCPGASTLLGNLLHTAQPSAELRDSVFRAPGSPPPKLAGRSWFAEYVRGCGHDLHLVAAKLPPGSGRAGRAGGRGAGGGGGSSSRSGSGVSVPTGLVGCSFGSVVSAAFQLRHLLVIGILAGDGFGRLVLNPPHRRRLGPSDQLVLLATSETHAESVREPAVVAAAAAATKRAEEAEEAAAAAAAAAAAGAAAAANPREAAAAFGGAHACSDSSGGDNGGGSNGSGGAEPQQQQQQQMRRGAAAAVADGGGGGGVSMQLAAEKTNSRATAIIAAASSGGGGGGGGLSRVKRYYPSLASWDEEMPDYFPDKEGTFFAGRPGEAAGGGGDNGWAGWQQGGGGGGGGGGGDADSSWGWGEVACDGPSAESTVQFGTSAVRSTASEGAISGGGVAEASGAGTQASEWDRGGGGGGGGGVRSGGGGQFVGSRYSYPGSSPRGSMDDGGGGAGAKSLNGSSSSINSLSGSSSNGGNYSDSSSFISSSSNGSSNGSSNCNGAGTNRSSSNSSVNGTASEVVPPYYMSGAASNGSSTGSGGSSSGSSSRNGNGNNSAGGDAAFASPYLDEHHVVSTEADIGAVHHHHPMTPASSHATRAVHFGQNGGGGGGLLNGSNSSSGNGSSVRANGSGSSSSGGSSSSSSSAGGVVVSTAAASEAPGGVGSSRAGNGRGPGGVAVSTSSSSSNKHINGSSSSGSSSRSSSSGGMNGSSSSSSGRQQLNGSGGLVGGVSAAYVSAATAGAVQAVGYNPPQSPMGRPYALVDAPWRQSGSSCAERRGHIILAGAIDSFVEFARVLHSCAGMRDPDSGISTLEVVVLHPNPPESAVLSLGAMGPTRVVRGSPADPRALQQAGAAQARCLVYLGHSERPAGPRNPSDTSSSSSSASDNPSDYGSTSKAGVQADAEALLTCYGVGEDSVPTVSEESGADECDVSAGEDWGPARTSTAGEQGGGGNGGLYGGAAGAVRGHSVVELSFTSSVRFLQPGLLLQGNSVWDESCALGGDSAVPRRSWRQRREAELAAAQQGLVQWQTNIYYGAGRVVVPALVDTFTIQAFAKRNLLLDVMSELCGDDGRPSGTQLRLMPVPRELSGRPYRELFDQLVSHGSVPLGLYRSKSENPAWRLHYVSTNPAWEDVVAPGDKVFVLRPAE